ncbi:MAG: type III pantothenate kinase [Bacteroidales bacterium]|nr:type III pantothenate kinase [Bacteroidales bacterium]
MNLLIDIGNTACKAAFANGKTIGKIYHYVGEEIADFIKKIIEKECPHVKPEIIVLSSVRNKDTLLEKDLKKECGDLIVFDTDFVSSLISDNEFSTEKNDPIFVLSNMPEGMGADRMAAILASHCLFPDKDLIVFDFGTATTVEFINGRKDAGIWEESKTAQYLGGAISLGLNTRYKALNYFTQKIPLLNPNDFLKNNKIQDISTIGTDIDTALAAGNILGIMFEIQGYIAMHPDRTIIFTGGDAIYFAERLKNSIFVVYNLVLMGLSHIAQHYAQTKKH